MCAPGVVIYDSSRKRLMLQESVALEKKLKVDITILDLSVRQMPTKQFKEDSCSFLIMQIELLT